MITVLYTVATGSMGGTQRFLDGVLSSHSRRFRPVLLAFERGAWLDEVRDRGITAYCLEGLRWRYPARCFHEVAKILRTENVAIVHSADAWCHALVAPAAMRFRCKRVWFNHGPIDAKAWQGPMPLVPAHLLLTNSQFMRDRLANTWHGARKIGVVPLGIDLERWRPDPARRVQFRQSHGIDSATLAIGIAGFIDVWKGQDVLLRAVKLARPRLLRLRVLIIGGPRDGLVAPRCIEFERELRAYCAQNSLDDLVTFTGHLDLREGALDALDVLVHASTEPEPFGMVLLEGMAKGKAIIASAEGGPREILTDQHDGLLVQPRSEAKLAAALEAIALDPLRRERLGEAALKTVNARFSTHVVTIDLERWYDAIL